MSEEDTEKFLRSATLAERFAALRVGYAYAIMTFTETLALSERISAPDGWQHIAPAWLRAVRERQVKG